MCLEKVNEEYANGFGGYFPELVLAPSHVIILALPKISRKAKPEKDIFQNQNPR